jgi:recombination protein RecT
MLASANLRADLMARKPTFADLLPAYIPVERFFRVALTVLTVDRRLVICDRASLFDALDEAARLGLLPDGPLGEAALVPQPGGVVELEITWRGYTKLARRHPDVITYYTDIVHSNDVYAFDPESGYFRHEDAEGDRAAPIQFYARAKLRDTDEWLTEFVERADVPASAYPEALGLTLAAARLYERLSAEGDSRAAI